MDIIHDSDPRREEVFRRFARLNLSNGINDKTIPDDVSKDDVSMRNPRA